MYVQVRRLGGFWSSLVSGSVKLFNATIPVAAAAATGGTSALVTAGAEEGLNLAAGAAKGKGGSSGGQGAPVAGGNFLTSLSTPEMVVGSLAVMAFVVAIGGRR